MEQPELDSLELDSLLLMVRIRERLVEESQRLDEYVAQLADDVERVSQQVMSLRRLVNDLLNTATLAEGVGYIHQAEQEEVRESQ